MATEKNVVKKQEPVLALPVSQETSHQFKDAASGFIWPDERKDEIVRPQNAPMPKMPIAAEKQAQEEKQGMEQQGPKPAEPEFKIQEQENKPVPPAREKKEDLNWHDEVESTTPGAEGDRPYNMHLFKRRIEEDK